MKRIFTPLPASPTVDAALLIARIGIGTLMLVHGIPKLLMLSSGPVQFPGVMGMSASLSLGLAVFAEVFCSVLLIAGLATRLAAIPLIVTMLVAVFSIHAADPFAVKEMGMHYLLVYLVLLVSGSGRYSLDYLLQRRWTGALQADRFPHKVAA